MFVSDQLWRNKLGKLENKKIDKWELNIEIWYPPAQNAIAFIEQVIDSNLTGMVLGIFFSFMKIYLKRFCADINSKV